MESEIFLMASKAMQRYLTEGSGKNLDRKLQNNVMDRKRLWDKQDRTPADTVEFVVDNVHKGVSRSGQDVYQLDIMENRILTTPPARRMKNGIRSYVTPKVVQKIADVNSVDVADLNDLHDDVHATFSAPYYDTEGVHRLIDYSQVAESTEKEAYRERDAKAVDNLDQHVSHALREYGKYKQEQKASQRDAQADV